MKPLGEWHWYLRRWLDGMPRLEVQGRTHSAREVTQS
jgi:hypothetical protein